MPPRAFVIAVVVAWLITVGWLVTDHWRLARPSERAPFAVDLADEVAPQNASWIVYRDGRPIGHAETRMAPRKDGTFELTTRLRDVDLTHGSLDLKMPLFAITRIVSHEGDLIRLDAKAVLNVKSSGRDVRVDATIRGHVDGDEFRGECELDTGDGKTVVPLQPVPIGPTGVFAPLQPLHKYPPLRPGQSWHASSVDTLSETLSIALGRVLGRSAELPPPFRPRRVVARVQSETDQITFRDKTYTCQVIVVEAEGVVARIWVDISDGKVVREEGSVLDQTITLQRV